MRFVWAVIKIIAFLVSTLAHYGILVAGKLLIVFGFDQTGWAATVRKRWGASVCRIMNIKITVEGTPPEPPFFVVCNHLSYIDVWVLFSQLRCTFIAKSDVRDWPIVGFILATSGILFVNRSKRTDVKRVNREVSQRLTDSQGMVLFPEGTTSPGDDILPFKSSLLQYPATNNLPVTSAYIRYETPDPENTARERICWWDDTPFFTHLFYAFVMKEISATITFLDETIKEPNRKVLADKTEGMIRASFNRRKDQKVYA